MQKFLENPVGHKLKKRLFGKSHGRIVNEFVSNTLMSKSFVNFLSSVQVFVKEKVSKFCYEILTCKNFRTNRKSADEGDLRHKHDDTAGIRFYSIPSARDRLRKNSNKSLVRLFRSNQLLCWIIRRV